MDPHSFIARAEAQRWIGIAEKLLIGHDLVGSKTFAIRARESDPRLEAADQILAIADTLLAAEKRVVGSNGTQQPDFYAILQLVRFVQDTDHIAAQYRRLAVTLNPHQNRFPYSDQAFQLVNDAWAVLSNPMRKSMYDSELDFPPQQQMNSIGFNLEQQHHHQQHHQQQHQHQQQQHNFFSINHMGSGHERELSEPPPTFQTRVQQSHQQQQLQQHNFLSQPNPIRPVPVREQEQLFQQREQEQLFQQREQEQLFQPQVQPFQITSTPQQQSRPPPQPPQPQPPMQPPTPPPPAAPPQPPLSWPQAPPLSQPQQPKPEPQQQQQAQPKPQPQLQQPLQPQPKPQPQLQQPHPHPQPHPQPQPHQPLQAQPKPQPQQQQPLQPQPQPPQPPLREQLRQKQLQQEQQQQQSLEQNAAYAKLPTQVNSNNGVMEEEIEIEIETETETETEAAAENVDDSPTFWTACPYCFYMYEYPRVYAECTLRCDNCKRAFQAVPIASPPPIIDGQEAYFCCWGFFPLGVSMSHLEKNNGMHANSKWTPFSPLYDASSNVQDHLNGRAAPKENIFVNKNSGPRFYIDDVVDDVFVGISEPSDDSDVEWGSSSTKKKKAKRMKKGLGSKKKAQVQVQVQAVAARITRNGRGRNLQDGIPVQEGVGIPAVPVAESSKKAVGSNPRRQSVRVKKELGKLDLNVEFNNNEGEEPAPGMTSGNRGHGQGEEDNIEGIGFFEGLDEFLSSLPILSVVNDEKVKAA